MFQASFSFPGMSSFGAYGEHSFSASPFLTHPGAVLREYESRCFSFLIQGLPAKSRRTYTAGQRQFEQFIQTLAAVSHHGPTLQVSESQIVLFVSWMSGTLSPATVGFYLAAVRSLHLHLSLFDPSQNAQRRRRMMKGYSALWWISKLASSPGSIGNSARDLPLVKHDFIA
jgi:hypothetical protein